MESFRAIIKAIGVSETATLLGISESHVRVMIARDSIPPQYWPALIAGAPEAMKEFVTTDGLLGIRNGRFADPKTSDASEHAA